LTNDPRIEGLLRELAPQALGVLVRRYGQFDACEDAVQEALLAAALQWPKDGVPDSPLAWLITVAERRYLALRAAALTGLMDERNPESVSDRGEGVRSSGTAAHEGRLETEGDDLR
jgi:predicted RNA polymerase sigma factor